MDDARNTSFRVILTDESARRIENVPVGGPINISLLTSLLLYSGRIYGRIVRREESSKTIRFDD